MAADDRRRSNGSGNDPFLHEYFSRFGAPKRGADAPLSIAFLIGSTDISGGTYVILQHALEARRSGADVTIVHIYEHRPEFGAWHAALTELPLVALEDAADLEFDLVVATMWRTVYELPRLRCAHAVYFVQSIESRFYGGRPETWAPPLAALTYTFDLPVITIARWIQAYLAFEHQRPSFLVHNGIRKDLYTPIGPTAAPESESRLRVLVEGPVDVPMKNVEESIELARSGGADEIWLLTSSEIGEHHGVDRVFSRVPIEQTPAIYRSCSVLLKLSHVEGMYGPPLEMFHCGGTVITYDVTGHDEFVRDGVNGIVVPMYERSGVIEAIRTLRDRPDVLRELRHGALRTARGWPDWDQSSAAFFDTLRLIARQPAPDHTHTMLAIRGAGAELPW
jgi:O-antigen biosynthesis protein